MGGHNHLPEIPDWKTFRVEDSPELMKVKKNLAARGLCYPWLRNEVWKFRKTDVRGLGQTLIHAFSGGFKYGLVAAIFTIAIDKAYLSYVDSKYGGHDEHH